MVNDGDIKWLPVSAAASRLGISRARVYQLIEDAVLLSIKVDSTVLVSGRSIDQRVAEVGRGRRYAA
jgi:hypothetical protein